MAVEGAEHLHEGFLCQVFRRLVVAHHPVGAVVHARRVAAHDFATGGFITLARPCQEFLVGCLGEIGKASSKGPQRKALWAFSLPV